MFSKDGDIPTPFDLCVHPKCLQDGEKSQSYLSKLSFHVNPMTSNNVSIWRSGMESVI